MGAGSGCLGRGLLLSFAGCRDLASWVHRRIGQLANWALSSPRRRGGAGSTGLIGKNCEAARCSSRRADLARQFGEILCRVARDKQLGLRAMPRQGDITRSRAPVIGMKQIGLVERSSLPFVDRAGIAVAERTEIPRIEIDRPELLGVETDRQMRAVDRLDGAGGAVGDALLAVVAGELDAVADGQDSRAERRRDS